MVFGTRTDMAPSAHRIVAAARRHSPFSPGQPRALPRAVLRAATALGFCVRRRFEVFHLCALALIPFASISPRAAAQDQAGPRESQPQPEEKRESDLSRRLVREAGGEQADDVMSEIIRLMEASSRRLEIDFDTGPQTEAVQEEILKNLDLAIAEASRRTRSRSSGPPSSSSDKRRRPESKGETDKSRKTGATSDAKEASEEAPPGVRPEAVQLPSGELRELRSGWGNLPLREREEMIQGSDEAFLDRYREWIERYYRALQEGASTQPPQP